MVEGEGENRGLSSLENQTISDLLRQPAAPQGGPESSKHLRPEGRGEKARPPPYIPTYFRGYCELDWWTAGSPGRLEA